MLANSASHLSDWHKGCRNADKKSDKNAAENSDSQSSGWRMDAEMQVEIQLSQSLFRRTRCRNAGEMTSRKLPLYHGILSGAEIPSLQGTKSTSADQREENGGRLSSTNSYQDSPPSNDKQNRSIAGLLKYSIRI
jgi:hypothetical protein